MKPRELPTANYLFTALVGSRYTSIYEINGLPGEYKCWRRWTVGVGKLRHMEETPGEIVKARLDGQVVKFVRIEEEGK
jgi:hypothetical protein